jgi:hypothetical protein
VGGSSVLCSSVLRYPSVNDFPASKLMDLPLPICVPLPTLNIDSVGIFVPSSGAGGRISSAFVAI